METTKNPILHLPYVMTEHVIMKQIQVKKRLFQIMFTYLHLEVCADSVFHSLGYKSILLSPDVWVLEPLKLSKDNQRVYLLFIFVSRVM